MSYTVSVPPKGLVQRSHLHEIRPGSNDADDSFQEKYEKQLIG